MINATNCTCHFGCSSKNVMKLLIPWLRGRRSTYYIARFMFFMIFFFLHLGDFVSTLLPNVWHFIRECCIDFVSKLLSILCSHWLFFTLLMLLLPQINHHLKFSIRPQFPINLRPYPTFRGTKTSIHTQTQLRTQRLGKKIQIYNLRRP